MSKLRKIFITQDLLPALIVCPSLEFPKKTLDSLEKYYILAPASLPRFLLARLGRILPSNPHRLFLSTSVLFLLLRTNTPLP
jgi:hypothetical protein